MSRSAQFQHVTDVEHILLRPSMYIGSMEKETRVEYVPAGDGFERREITVVPGLLKIFDEIVSNAADNAQRDSGMTAMRVDIDRDTGRVTVWNDGRNVPVERHPSGVYTPSLVFGSLRTSSNFDDTQQRTTVGVHGIGSKAANVFSQTFSVEIVDAHVQLKFRQTWSDNMARTESPNITPAKSAKRDSISVSFVPEYSRFGYDGLDDDTFAAMQRRVYDVAATLSSVKVTLCGQRIKFDGFKDYVKMFVSDRDIVCKDLNEHWTVAVARNGHGDGMQCVSFVNNSLTRLGGQHVDAVANAVAAELIAALKRKKKGCTVKPAQVKNELFLFVKCVIVNPTFSSQTKDTMTKRVDSFALDSGFVRKLVDSDIFESVVDLFTRQAERALAKTDGTKRSTIQVEKLDDAVWAGTRRSSQCVLFLTEGDSAKGFVVKGITSIQNGRDRYGVYPLRGKVLNVRDKTEDASAIAGNAELNNIKKILGLEHRRDYSQGTSSLRYGAVCIVTDADVDGDHIKGLIMNFFDTQFPSLLGHNRGFLMEFVTPIVRCKRGRDVVSFYSLSEFEQWYATAGPGWAVKYYKGLATSQTHEIKEYFADLDAHLKRFLPTDAADREKMDIVFNKKRVNERKEWLRGYDPRVHRDQTLREHKISDFFDQGMIHFSISDNVRSIPSVVDGLKVAQRKILWTMLQRIHDREIKVAQLAGEVANFTHYHHGEQSLAVCAVLMGQNFLGTNNVNLLYPAGDFGTRMEGPSKTGAPRYIFTSLEPWTRAIFCADDDPVLSLRVEEGCPAEPYVMVPTIPMALVNGTVGIGSGFSTNVPSFCIESILDALEDSLTRGRLSREDLDARLKVWYRGFKGTITRDSPDKWTVRGVFERVSDTRIRITELPLSWSGPYKDFLGQLVAEKTVRTFVNGCTETDVDFDVELAADITDDEIWSRFKLTATVRTSNMVLFDTSGVLRSYASAADIFLEYFEYRYRVYAARKAAVLAKKESETAALRTRVRFLERVANGTYKLNDSGLEQRVIQDGFSKDVLKMPLSAVTHLDKLVSQLASLERATEDKMRPVFKTKYRFDERVDQAVRLRTKYPEFVPVICEVGDRTDLPPLDRTKYIVPGDVTVGQFMYVIRKRIRVPPEKALFLFTSSKTIPATSTLMTTAYSWYGDEDGFLYLTVTGENTFGFF
ncbi:DNA topoisomerase 2 [Allomyces javanicus]|nr:DNA topoisomerase 2 [Allomyces javanicus]